MKRIGLAVLSALGLALAACSGANDGTGGTGGTGACNNDPCTISSQCPAGEQCKNECCEQWEGCRPEDCTSPQFCDANSGNCVDPATHCDDVGCSCSIVSGAGVLEVSATPSFTMGAGGTADLKLVVTENNGGPVPGATASYTVTDPAVFTVSGSTITAVAGSGGNTTVTASVTGVSNAITCTATLNNLGDAPGGGNVRFYAYDDATGEAISAVTVIVDSDGDGIDNGLAPLTGSDGVTETTLAPGGAYTVTAFASGYHYLSIVGLTTAAVDVALPLQVRPVTPQVGGYTGKIDFTEFEANYLDSQPKALKFAIAASSFPLKALLNFDLSLFVGSIKTGCTTVGAGCYAIDLADFVPGGGTQVVGLPGGLVLSLVSSDIKDFIDVVGAPGRRFAWTLGGELEITDLAGLINIVLPFLSDCTCNGLEDVVGSEDVCDAETSTAANPVPSPSSDNECSCDTDCGVSVDFGQIFNSLLPLFANFASGVQGNVPLASTSETSWESYITPTYDQRTDSAAYPKLDDESACEGADVCYGKLTLREQQRLFSELAMPGLPNDPLAGAGRKMEAMVVLTGIEEPGQGYVPLGLSAGIDCTEGDCLDYAGNMSNFDGLVNGGEQCDYDPDPTRNRCPAGVPETVANGHVGLFHAPAHSGLSDDNWLTVVAALPLDSFTDGTAFRVTSYMVRDEPDTTTAPGTSNMLNCGSACTFPGYPALSASTTGRSYTASSSTFDIQWVTFSTPDDANGDAHHWNVYFPGGGGTFTAPIVPGGPDPFAPAGPDESVTEGFIAATQLGFRFQSGQAPSLDELAANDGTSLNELLSDLQGFGVMSAEVCASAGCL